MTRALAVRKKATRIGGGQTTAPPPEKASVESQHAKPGDRVAINGTRLAGVLMYGLRGSFPSRVHLKTDPHTGLQSMVEYPDLKIYPPFGRRTPRDGEQWPVEITMPSGERRWVFARLEELRVIEPA